MKLRNCVYDSFLWNGNIFSFCVYDIFFSVSFHLQRFEENSYVNYITSPLAVLFSFTAVSQVYVSLSV